MSLITGLDNELAFVAETVQQVAKALKIQWKLHTAHCPQSSGKVESMNQTLKQTLAKLSGDQLTCCHVDQLTVDMLPVALLKVRCSAQAGIGFSPLEILYGRPLSLVNLRGYTRELGNLDLYRQLQGLGYTTSQIHEWIIDIIPISLGITVHPHQPGDQVWVKDWKIELLKPMWKGSYSVILTPPTALKVQE